MNRYKITVYTGNEPYSFWWGGIYYQNVIFIPVPPIYQYGLGG